MLKDNELVNGLLVKVDFSIKAIAYMADPEMTGLTAQLGSCKGMVGEIVKPPPWDHKGSAPGGYTVWFPALNFQWPWGAGYLKKL